jgi:nucleoside-diphosphate-sugar epimerase
MVRATGSKGSIAMTTCLVTSGAGFLGSHLCDELLRRGEAMGVERLVGAATSRPRHFPTCIPMLLFPGW